MIYSNLDVKRQDRLCSEQLATQLLLSGEYGVLSMYNEEYGAYGIPMSYVWDGKDSIYIHCAPDGRKLLFIDENNLVSFCIVGKTNVISDKFTTEYESIILECEASRSLKEEERLYALSLILDKYSPKDKIVGMKYAKKSFGRTEIIRLDVNKWSGKSKSI